MGYGTFEDTHKKIVESGMRLFLQNGYERTNLRELCKEAGITTGSFYRHFTGKEDLFGYLVQPAVDGITSMYQESEELCFDYIEEERLKEIWQISEDTVKGFIEFIYQNYDCFKLLLQCADGTKYSTFVDDMVKEEVRGSLKLMSVLKLRDIKVNELSEQEFHMLSHAYIASIFEAVMHDYTKEEVMAYACTIVRFFSAGWREVLGL